MSLVVEPLHVIAKLRQTYPWTDYVLYERPGEARIAANPRARAIVYDDFVQIEVDGRISRMRAPADPLHEIPHILGRLQPSPWTAYGYFAFDLASRTRGGRPSACPLAHLVVPDIEIRITAESVSARGVPASFLNADPRSVAEPAPPAPAAPVALDAADRDAFCERVRQAIDVMGRTSLQKVILARSVVIARPVDFLGTYAVGVSRAVAVRTSCFQLGDVEGITFSPEILLQSDGRGSITTNPLAGTRPRHLDREIDASLRRQLFASAKEVKEHALSVLEAQREVASVCAPDSVHITDFMDTRRFQFVQHLSSRVSGRLRAGQTSWDAIRALFPAVTVSGIPKRPAIQLIGELESSPRGAYSGAVGWVDHEGAADLALAIRGAFRYGSRVHVNAGAGIIPESVPAQEYEESVNKMQAMLTSLVLQRTAADTSYALR